MVVNGKSTVIPIKMEFPEPTYKRVLKERALDKKCHNKIMDTVLLNSNERKKLRFFLDKILQDLELEYRTFKELKYGPDRSS